MNFIVHHQIFYNEDKLNELSLTGESLFDGMYLKTYGVDKQHNQNMCEVYQKYVVKVKEKMKIELVGKLYEIYLTSDFSFLFEGNGKTVEYIHTHVRGNNVKKYMHTFQFMHIETLKNSFLTI
jgi:hypothetical protein